MAASSLIPPAVSTRYLLAELRCSRSWQRAEIANATDTTILEVSRWGAASLDALQPDRRRAVETLLSVSTTVPWWERGHA